MSGNMISWPTIDMVGMGMAAVSISIIRIIIKHGGPAIFRSLKLFIPSQRYLEKKKTKFATSEKDKEALRRKTIEDLCERIYIYRDEGKPDSQLVKVMTTRVRDLIGDQIQKEDEIGKIMKEIEEQKAAKRMNKNVNRSKTNVVQVADVIPQVWPLELNEKLV